MKLFSSSNIDQGLKNYQDTPGAVLLDVRTPEEYGDGHIPGSKNVPLQNITNVANVVENKDTPLYVYCHSGARSQRATKYLQLSGYTNVNNIGGIASYSGDLEK